MTVRYVAVPKRAPRADYYEEDWGYGKVHLPRLSAIEDDTPVDTGLVDKRGLTIWRVNERGKVGF
jgi:hypothetical protein